MTITTPGFWHKLDHFLARLRPHREPLSLAIDAAVVALAWNATYLFRLGFERWVSARPGYDGWVLLAIVAVYVAALWAARVPQAMWRFSGMGELQRLAAACAIAGLVAAAGVRMAELHGVPRAVLALHPVFALMGMALVRLAYRAVYEHGRARITGGDAEVRRAIVMGAGEAAKRLLAGIHRQGWIVLGLLDDDPHKQGARIAGIPVLGPLDAINDKAVRGAATHVVIAMPAAKATQRRRALELAAPAGLPVLTVPSADELREGQSAIERLREIEPEDLLGREPVQLDEAGIGAVLSGKTVLITGAGGSIGSELCRQVARFQPARIVLYELSEFNLYTIEQELGDAFPHIPLVRLIGDVKDLAHLRHTFAKWQPNVVFHAAAFKHVPLMEEENAWACLRNNTLGTYNACQVAAEHATERFVLISTDKAVNPTNVMGATKRAAELVISHMAAECEKKGQPTKFMAVRFGNVLGSSGSVIPKFKDQIAKGGPVTVTHPDITRYFMTIPEAAKLVVQACALGGCGQVYVLNMGESVKILDLARDMIRLSGHSLEEIGIEFTGLRPGEKLYEELLANEDQTLPTTIPLLRIAKLKDDRGGGRIEAWLADVLAQNNRQSLRRSLQELLPSEYSPEF